MKENDQLIEIITAGVAFAIAYLFLMSGSQALELPGVIMLGLTLVILMIYLITTARNSIKDQSKKIKEGIIPAIDDIQYGNDVNEYISAKIKSINKYYSNNKMQENIAECDIASLVRRRNYLESGKKPLGQIVTIFTAVVTSVIASSVYGFITTDNNKRSVVVTNIALLIVGVILLIVVLRNEKSENIDSVHDYIRDYEIRLIDSEIEQIQQNILADNK